MNKALAPRQSPSFRFLLSLFLLCSVSLVFASSLPTPPEREKLNDAVDDSVDGDFEMFRPPSQASRRRENLHRQERLLQQPNRRRMELLQQPDVQQLLQQPGVQQMLQQLDQRLFRQRIQKLRRLLDGIEEEVEKNDQEQKQRDLKAMVDEEMNLGDTPLKSRQTSALRTFLDARDAYANGLRSMNGVRSGRTDDFISGNGRTRNTFAELVPNALNGPNSVLNGVIKRYDVRSLLGVPLTDVVSEEASPFKYG